MTLEEYLNLDKESQEKYLDSLSYVELKELMMQLALKLNDESGDLNGN